MRRLVAAAILVLMISACATDESTESVNSTATATNTTPTMTTTTEASTTTTTSETTTPRELEGSEVTISWVIHEDPDRPKEGTFTVSGPAVDQDLLCSAGTTLEILWEQGTGQREISHVEYTCEDGSGTFDIESEYKGSVNAGDGTVEETGVWTIWGGSGSGPYKRLSGNGTMSGVIELREGDTQLTGPTNASETFLGYVSIDP